MPGDGGHALLGHAPARLGRFLLSLLGLFRLEDPLRLSDVDQGAKLALRDGPPRGSIAEYGAY